MRTHGGALIMWLVFLQEEILSQEDGHGQGITQMEFALACSSLQNLKKVTTCCLNHSSCGILL